MRKEASTPSLWRSKAENPSEPGENHASKETVSRKGVWAGKTKTPTQGYMSSKIIFQRKGEIGLNLDKQN